jgi:single-strand DNA-binding protein
MADNTVSLVGNLTRDPEMRFGANGGIAVVSFGMAVNHRKKSNSGEWEDEPKFFDVVAFGDLAENIAASLTKGTRIVLNGKLDWSQWDDKDGGGKRSKVQVIAESIGPDLRWATAVVTRTQPTSGGHQQRENYGATNRKDLF